MSLQHAILVSLAEKSASGYDLTRRFDKSIGFFWNATHQQIYRTLASMESAQLVTARSETGTGRPDRKVYSLSPAGREALRRWTQEPTPYQPLRSEFAVKVRGMTYGDRAAVLADIRAQRDRRREQLDYYLQDERRNFPDPSAIPPKQLPVWLVLRGGIRQEQMFIDWCDEMLAALES